MSAWDDTPAAMDEYGESLAKELQTVVMEGVAQKLEAAFRVSDAKNALKEEAKRR